MIKVIFLGTNGWYDTQTGNTVSTLIETEKAYIVLDAGIGIYKLDKYIKKNKPVHLFLSHFHLDHIMGLHVLALFNFKKTLNIYGQEGTRILLERFVARPYTMPFNDLPYKTQVYDLPEGLEGLPFSVEYKELLHSTKCIGFRFKIEDKIIAYCSDTGVCENAKVLANGADLLIAECAFAPGQRHEKWPHMNPTDAAGLAKEAGAKKLMLTHFDASIYTDIKKRKQAQVIAGKIFKKTFAAFDDIQVKI